MINHVICLGVIRVVNTVRVVTAHVYGANDVIRNAVENSIEGFNSKTQSVFRFSSKDWLINLNVLASCLCQGQYFQVKCISQIPCEFIPVVVMAIRRHIHDG